MNVPLIDALLAEQDRQRAALERMLRTVARWAGLPDGAVEEDSVAGKVNAVEGEGANPFSASAARAPAPAAPAGGKTGLPPDQPRSSGIAFPPTQPRREAASAQISGPEPATSTWLAVPESAKGWQVGLPPARATTAASFIDDRSGEENSSDAKPPRSVPQASLAGQGPVGHKEGVELPLLRANLRALANGPAESGNRTSSPSPPGRTTALRRSRLIPLEPGSTSPTASSLAPADHGMVRSGVRGGPPVEIPTRDASGRTVAWGRMQGTQSTVVAPSLVLAPPLARGEIPLPGPEQLRASDVTRAVPVDTHWLDLFPESTLEEAIADLLERAAREAGIDLT